MPTRILLPAVIVALAIGNADAADRRVLVEFYLNDGSEASRLARDVLEPMLEQEQALGNIVFVNYHTHWPAHDDLFEANGEELERRIQQYGVQYVPMLRINGMPWFAVHDFESYDEFEARAAVSLAAYERQSSTIGLEVSARMTSTMCRVDVDLAAEDTFKPFFDVPELGPRLVVAVLGQSSSGSGEFLGFLSGDYGDALGLWIDQAPQRTYYFSEGDVARGANPTAVVAWIEEGFGPVTNAAYTPIKIKGEGGQAVEGAVELSVLANPFQPSTGDLSISYSLPRAGNVLLEIYDASGARVRTLARGDQSPGTHRIAWDGVNSSGLFASSGMYVIRLKTGAEIQSRKVFLLR